MSDEEIRIQEELLKLLREARQDIDQLEFDLKLFYKYALAVAEENAAQEKPAVLTFPPRHGGRWN